jgi:hypothetical protein
MIEAARELPTTGYALEVDGRMKTEFKTKDGARIGAQELKGAFRCCVSRSTTRRRGQKKKSRLYKAEP